MWNGRKINLEAEKWYGKQRMDIGHKKLAGVGPPLPNALRRRQCQYIALNQTSNCPSLTH